MAGKLDQDVCSSSGESTTEASPSGSLSRSSSGEPLELQGKLAPTEPVSYDPNLWYIHGQSYDLKGFVDRHPGGRLAILSGRGRDCTALFESYHPWNDRHRRVLQAFGPKPPPPDPFYESIKERVRQAFPGGGKDTKMRTHCMVKLTLLWCLMMVLFFLVRTPLSCAAAGVLVATVGTRMAHEGGHYQISRKEWVNRLYLFLGYFLAGPSMAWHYRHVISHHAYTNQEEDVDVVYVWLADKLPKWIKVLVLPVLPILSVIEVGPKMIFDMLVLQSVGGCKVDLRIGGILLEVPIWCAFHWYFGPPMICYLFMWWTSGAIFMPCSQVAHAILFPKPQDHPSWARLQIAESCDFAADSDFWYHVAFGLTTQTEHHLFPGVAHWAYDSIRLLVREVCKENGVVHNDLSAKEAFSALWRRWYVGEIVTMAAA